MSTPIPLLNFLDDNADDIVERTATRITRQRRGRRKTGAASSEGMTALLRRLYDGYVDLLVTGQTDVLERLYRSLARVLKSRRLRYSDVFVVPLIMSEAIREGLLDAYKDDVTPDTLTSLQRSMKQVESTGQRASIFFLDAVQDHLTAMVDDHNTYLRRVAAELGATIEPLRIHH
jgi:hypothetical protein